MRHAARAQPRDMIGDRLAGVGQHHRAATDDGAQQDLQTAVAANVVEGGPHRRASARRAVGHDRAGQSFQGMADNLRHAGSARRQHQPVRGALAPYRRTGADRRLRGNHQSDAGVGPSRRMVGHHRIDPGVLEQNLDVIEIEIGRTQQHSARDAVDLRHRDRGYQLIRHRKQHRTPGELAKTAAKTGPADAVGQRHQLSRIRDRSPGDVRPKEVTEREHLTRGHFHRPASPK